MRIFVARESDPAEPRVAATPETVKKMAGLGAEVTVEPGAGIKSGILDADYNAAGSTLSDNGKDADVVLRATSPARSSSPSWIRSATTPRSPPWPGPGCWRLPWS
jgi:NAD(P) transhydrogenase subunit alpha